MIIFNARIPPQYWPPEWIISTFCLPKRQKLADARDPTKSHEDNRFVSWLSDLCRISPDSVEDLLVRFRWILRSWFFCILSFLCSLISWMLPKLARSFRLIVRLLKEISKKRNLEKERKRFRKGKKMFTLNLMQIVKRKWRRFKDKMKKKKGEWELWETIWIRGKVKLRGTSIFQIEPRTTNLEE